MGHYDTSYEYDADKKLKKEKKELTAFMKKIDKLITEAPDSIPSWVIDNLETISNYCYRKINK